MQNITFQKDRHLFLESGSRVDYWNSYLDGQILLGIHIERTTYNNGKVSTFQDGSTYWIGGYNAHSDKMIKHNFAYQCKSLDEAREKIEFILSTNQQP